ILSNVLMYDFDNAVSAAVAKDHVTYSRYADDLTFSALRTGHLVNVERTVRSVIRTLKYPNLSINEEKTTRVTLKYNRRVTGVTLSNEGKVSLGRDRKRAIEAAVHHFTTGKILESEVGELKGILGFAKSVEPEFIERLIEKYGEGV